MSGRMHVCVGYMQIELLRLFKEVHVESLKIEVETSNRVGCFVIVHFT